MPSWNKQATTMTLGDTDWHQVTAAYTAEDSGDTLHYFVYASNLASSSQNFLADCLSCGPRQHREKRPRESATYLLPPDSQQIGGGRHVLLLDRSGRAPAGGRRVQLPEPAAAAS